MRRNNKTRARRKASRAHGQKKGGILANLDDGNIVAEGEGPKHKVEEKPSLSRNDNDGAALNPEEDRVSKNQPNPPSEKLKAVPIAVKMVGAKSPRRRPKAADATAAIPTRAAQEADKENSDNKCEIPFVSDHFRQTPPPKGHLANPPLTSIQINVGVENTNDCRDPLALLSPLSPPPISVSCKNSSSSTSNSGYENGDIDDNGNSSTTSQVDTRESDPSVSRDSDVTSDFEASGLLSQFNSIAVDVDMSGTEGSASSFNHSHGYDDNDDSEMCSYKGEETEEDEEFSVEEEDESDVDDELEFDEIEEDSRPGHGTDKGFGRRRLIFGNGLGEETEHSSDDESDESSSVADEVSNSDALPTQKACYLEECEKKLSRLFGDEKSDHGEGGTDEKSGNSKDGENCCVDCDEGHAVIDDIKDNQPIENVDGQSIQNGSLNYLKPGSNSAQATQSVVPAKDPSLTEEISNVDYLFCEADKDTVTAEDAAHSITNRVNIPKGEKGIEKIIKARLSDLTCGKASAECDWSLDAHAHDHDLDFDAIGYNGSNVYEMNKSASQENSVEEDFAESCTSQLEVVDCDEPSGFSQLTFGISIGESCADATWSENDGVMPDASSGRHVENKFVSLKEAEHLPCAESSMVSDSFQTSPCAALGDCPTTANQIEQEKLHPDSAGCQNSCTSPLKNQFSHTNTLQQQKDSQCEDQKCAKLSGKEDSHTGSLLQKLSPGIVGIQCRTPLVQSDKTCLSMAQYFGDSLKSRNMVEKGKWSLGSQIGSGSFGRVYTGMNANTGSIMAVKVLEIPSNDKPAILEDLQREISLLKSLDHPNIVRYLGAEVDDCSKTLYIFQEWAPGGSISALLEKFGPFSTTVVKTYVRQILKGLDYLHSHGIIHRDIKGGNILVSNDGAIKLADFGASKQVEAFEAESTMEMTMRGTPWFMAPEVFEEKYGSKADIWSVGGVIYQMVTCSPPWKDLGFKSPVSLFRHLKSHDRPPKLPWLRHCDGPDRILLEGILSRCFQREPLLRPNAVTLMGDDWFCHGAERIEDKDESPVSPSDLNKRMITKVNTDSEPTRSTDAGPKSTLQSPLNQIPENDLSDSLCYSLTIQPHLFSSNDKEMPSDDSQWPDWARRRDEEKTAQCNEANPFAIV